MKIIIDYRNTFKNQTALRTFTDEFWRDFTSLHPAHVFVLLTTGKKELPETGQNLEWRRLRKLPLQWLDNARRTRMVLAMGADRMITLHGNTFAFDIYFADKQHKKLPALPNKQLQFTAGAGASTHPQPVYIRPAQQKIITELSWAEAESTKTQYTGGRSFFLFTGDIGAQHQLIELLKAFSVFKKWQQSNMQLVITGSYTDWTDTLEEKLQTYKYRQDVVLLKNKNTDVTARLVAACYAMLYPVSTAVFPLALLWAVQSHKAVIATGNDTNRRLTSAALWVEENQTAEGFSKAMILLYRDESQLQLLVQQAKQEAAVFDRQQMLAAVWQHIEQ
jgi:glycosyltransferase involved in cell wall biosynthesis